MVSKDSVPEDIGNAVQIQGIFCIYIYIQNVLRLNVQGQKILVTKRPEPISLDHWPHHLLLEMVEPIFTETLASPYLSRPGKNQFQWTTGLTTSFSRW